MSYMPQDLDRLLAEAVGASPHILASLRADFLGSALAQLAALETAETVENWRDAAHKLQGLAASFGLTDLMWLAAATARAKPSPALIAPIRAMLTELSQH
ncbi:Hpt domain-containing protein [Sphingomonas crocodyli]|uniref:Hpt domain-containing protein n=1 Tax=Sphingomonas crocodyli TaxID=1979270 RepID=A0A437M440_9SPHN|nr:Hpt domain-containing protein [Sphingomonas crocodyli]RVT92439.1 Hpt domain-containing protein [Sphingomonas crocodyli]